MYNNYNPFKENRAEQMKELLNYYVPIPGLESINKPVVIEGGRGSGKTMFFLCNSWRENSIQFEKEGQPISNIYTQMPFIGIYYRVDTAFVSAMIGKEREDWNVIFETYLSICLLKEILQFLELLNNEPVLNKAELRDVVIFAAQKFEEKSTVETISSFLDKIENYLDEIEDIINGIRKDTSFRFIRVNRFITDVCVKINKLIKKDNIFKIFIDEYETLQEYQQRVVNTLIKHSTLPVLYNIGLRPRGMKTNLTISETETIESPHDYEDFQLTVDEKEYLNILKQICSKRILYGKEIGQIPLKANEDIEYYLGNYDIEYEIEQITDSKRVPKYMDELKSIIALEGKEKEWDEEKIKKIQNLLCDETRPINSKLHYLLLKHKTSYSPRIEELVYEYTNKTDRYKDWEHNRKFGIVFMLAKDYSKGKMYYGFDVYAALSSGIVRYFLELCEQAFRMELIEDYQWDRVISPERQTQAAKYVSEYKVADINGYEPVGKELRIFVQYLGQIFKQLHIADNITQGEPEPNHFHTNDLALNATLEKLLSYAIMWNVLQTDEPTKKKQPSRSVETVDYHLNKIYVPYFEISYRDIRKIFLPIDILEQLLSGNVDMAKEASNKYLKSKNKSNNVIAENKEKYEQLTLFQGDKIW